jgi:hypothetical protein
LDPAHIAPETLRPLSRTEYERLVEAGAFEDERVELLRGWLVRMSPQCPEHAHLAASLGHQLTLALADRALVSQHSPLALGDDSEPEPDVAVVPPGDYRHAHPRTAWLVIEVADSSLNKDRGPKAALYAERGIDEYWLVDLQSRRVHVHREPTQDGYTQIEVAGPTDTLSPLRFPDVRVPVGELLR